MRKSGTISLSARARQMSLIFSGERTSSGFELHCTGSIDDQNRIVRWEVLRRGPGGVTERHDLLAVQCKPACARWPASVAPDHGSTFVVLEFHSSHAATCRPHVVALRGRVNCRPRSTHQLNARLRQHLDGRRLSATLCRQHCFQGTQQDRHMIGEGTIGTLMRSGKCSHGTVAGERSDGPIVSR